MENQSESREILEELPLQIASGEDIEAIAEIAEGSIDLFLKDGFVKEIPYVSWVSAAYKVYHSVSDRLLFKKVANFLANVRGISESERKRFLDEIASDKKFKTRVAETVLSILDKLNDMDKTKYIGRLFPSYIKGLIDLNQFKALSDIVDKIFLLHLHEFDQYANGKLQKEIDLEKYFRSGISIMEKEMEFVTRTGKSSGEIRYSLSPEGKLLRSILRGTLEQEIKEMEDNLKAMEKFF